jgi:hypothetical protein
MTLIASEKILLVQPPANIPSGCSQAMLQSVNLQLAWMCLPIASGNGCLEQDTDILLLVALNVQFCYLFANFDE